MAKTAYDRKEDFNMALTKAQVKEILSAAGCPAENVETAVAKILDGHLTSINALREERDGFKAAAEKLKDVQKELDGLKAKGDPDWEKKYTDEHSAFETYKKEVETAKAKREKANLYRELLKSNKVDEKRIDAIMKVTDLDKISVKDGKLEGEDALTESIKKEWAGFILTESERGAKVDNPPQNDAGAKKEPSRAKQLAAAYHEQLYGKAKEGDS